MSPWLWALATWPVWSLALAVPVGKFLAHRFGDERQQSS